MKFSSVLRVILGACLGILVTYILFLSLLTVPYFQDHAIYLHKIRLTWGHDLNEPERWGFLKNQVTSFNINTPDGEVLHVWHILPLELYRQHESALRQESTGLIDDVTSRLSFQLLQSDPDALLVIYLHGAAGTLGSGYRPPSYRALSAAAPTRIHVVAIDYRGFGMSTGWPSEPGLLIDAMALADWAITAAGISPSRIVVFGQSIGTAVALSLSSSLAKESPPTLFAGIVLVAPFSDVETLTATYQLAGMIPLLSPIARVPSLLKYLNKFIVDKWDSARNIADLVRCYQTNNAIQAHYHISLIHAEDDYDIHWSHSERLFWHAVNASSADNVTYEDLQQIKQEQAILLGAAGRTTVWQTNRGIVREEILKYGLHDKIMSYPVVSRAVIRAFGEQIFSGSTRSTGFIIP